MPWRTFVIKNSIHKAEVIKLSIQPHPNADRLEIARVWGYEVVIGKGQFKDGDLGVFLPPDSVVPDTPLYAFLSPGSLKEKDRRIGAKRLRGIWSQGLLMPLPDGPWVEGDDLSEVMGITHWNPPEPSQGASNKGQTQGKEDLLSIKGLDVPIYDLENWYRFQELFSDTHEVAITEKIHGANARFVCWNNQMFVGSRRLWKREGWFLAAKKWSLKWFLEKLGFVAPKKILSQDQWWKVLRKYPQIEGFCRANPGLVLFGEVYGAVQDYRYGHTRDELSFMAFDLYDTTSKEFLSWERFRDLVSSYKIPVVPILWVGCYTKTKVQELLGGTSKASLGEAPHPMEGVVIKATGSKRLVLKAVSPAYLEKRKGS